ncbi:hypothetical protein UFOVP203_18 [uncultured Caudovirales phage]|uniref:Homeodomain phBC6A51-type domain-containing protein n=1 Tax=uncultured Caudovirales phage TaxID=2100421 RepID=A0A6J7WR25_9CAUD|nr:hypothetical protein UFOVP203_18 [uncultured Caudovirales phage]
MNAQFKDITKEAFIIAYRENFGNITISCQACGISRTMYQNWMKNDMEFRKTLAEIEPEEIMLDWGEHKLMERITKGDTLATMFLLKTKGKRRGYIEKQEIVHEADVVKQITVNVLKPGASLEDVPKIDGDEHKKLPESSPIANLQPEDGGILNFDTQTDNTYFVPATSATVPTFDTEELMEVPLYNHDKGELLDLNENDEYEE